jgi:hypothetical protein
MNQLTVAFVIIIIYGAMGLIIGLLGFHWDKRKVNEEKNLDAILTGAIFIAVGIILIIFLKV